MKSAALKMIAFTLACSFAGPVAFAADPAPAATTTPAATAPNKIMTPQQQKMTTCAQGARGQGLKGADYKAYMSTCLKGDGNVTPALAPTAPVAAVPAAPLTQQQKMKACNADPQAKTLKGDDRKTFMKTCLSGAPAAAAAH